MTLNKLNAGILGLARRVAGLLIRPPSREPRAVTTRARAASLAVALMLLGTAEVRAEELLETLVPGLPVPGSGLTAPATGVVPLRQGDTYRVVVTGIITLTIPTNPPRVDRYDAVCLLLPSGPDNAFRSVAVSVIDNATAGVQGVSLPFNCNAANRYEVTFVANINGVLRAEIGGPPNGLLTTPRPTDTSTIRVELFGERAPSCADRAAMTEAVPEPGCPVSFCDGRPVTIEAIPEVPTFGTPGNDVIVGTEGADQLFGLGGRDIICGLGGNDVISGNSGRDRVLGGPGDDQITGGDDGARDFLFGEDGQDRLNGGKGNDILDGGPGVDRMIGGPGEDTMFVNGVGIVFNPDDNTFTRQGDVLLGGPDEDQADYSQLPGPVRVNLRRGSKRQRGGEILSSIEDLRGTPGDDRLIGNDEDNLLFGGGGDDLLDVRDFGFDFAEGEPGSDTCIGNFDEDANERDRARGCENVIER